MSDLSIIKKGNQESESSIPSKLFNFPLDCIGEILRYTSSSSVVYLMKSLDSYTKNYIENYDPECCRNVNFVLKRSFEGEKRYVMKMDLEHWDYCGVLEKVKNLKELIVRCYDAEEMKDNDGYLKNGHGEFVLGLKCVNLERLDITVFNVARLKEEFKGLVKLKSLRIMFLFDGMIQITQKGLNFEYLNNLERLELIEVRKEKMITNDTFVPLKKLKFLKVTKCLDIIDSHFKLLPNVKTLILIKCHQVTLKGIKLLKKLEKLHISDCRNIKNFKGLNSNIEISNNELSRKLRLRLRHECLGPPHCSRCTPPEITRAYNYRRGRPPEITRAYNYRRGRPLLMKRPLRMKRPNLPKRK